MMMLWSMGALAARPRSGKYREIVQKSVKREHFAEKNRLAAGHGMGPGGVNVDGFFFIAFLNRSH